MTKTLPDFVDGETKEFELYWDDNTEVNTEEDENLFLSLNAVLQRPKFTEGYPLQDSYFIDRSVIPNVSNLMWLYLGSRSWSLKLLMNQLL